jgi:arginyl-tRNA synthetase
MATTTIASELERAFRAAIHAAFGVDADPLVGPAQNEKFGDYQANAAMGLAKTIGQSGGQKTNPRAVAEQIKAKLELGEMASEVSIAGPGFINVKLAPAFLSKRLAEAAGAADQRLGVGAREQPQTVVVDYSGPNIAKEMHVGHLRSTIIGDAVSRVLEFIGDKVIRQNHIGDWGTQFGKVILSIWTIANASRTAGEMAAVLDDGEKLGALARAESKARDGKDAAGMQAVATQRRANIERVGRRHQAWLDADADGKRFFAPFLEKYQPVLGELLPVYQMVTSVEAAPEAAEFTIRGPYGSRPLAEQSKLVTHLLQKGQEQEINAWKKVRAATMDECQRLYERLAVKLRHEDERGESSYNEDLASVVRELRSMGLAVESQGAVGVFIDGPDKPPLIIEKSGGEGYLYGTTDLAAIRYRVRTLRADRILYFVDARQAQHFIQVFATAKKARWAEGVSLEHAAFGTMLGPDGKPFKTRSGDTVKLKDLLDEAEERALKVVTEKNPELPEGARAEISRAVGIGAVKYADLSKDRTSDYLFSFEKMLALEGNTAPYLQNAYVRVKGIFRRARALGIEPKVDYSALRLESPFELAIAKHVLRLPEVLELVSRELKPHHLCNYLYELATKYHAFFENCPVLQSEEPTRSSRLALCDVTARTLGLGLDLLGIEHPDQM